MRLEWGPYGEYRAEGIELASMPLLHWLRDIWEHTTIISDEVCDAGEMQVVWHPLLRCRGIAWGGGVLSFPRILWRDREAALSPVAAGVTERCWMATFPGIVSTVSGSASGAKRLFAW